MKKLIVSLAALSMILLGTTYAAVDNIQVSGDITAGAITRDLSMGAVGDSYSGDNIDSEDFLYSQVRVRFDAVLTEGVSAVVNFRSTRTRIGQRFN